MESLFETKNKTAPDSTETEVFDVVDAVVDVAREKILCNHAHFARGMVVIVRYMFDLMDRSDGRCDKKEYRKNQSEFH
jgi:hypothetical protein